MPGLPKPWDFGSWRQDPYFALDTRAVTLSHALCTFRNTDSKAVVMSFQMFDRFGVWTCALGASRTLAVLAGERWICAAKWTTAVRAWSQLWTIC